MQTAKKSRSPALEHKLLAVSNKKLKPSKIYNGDIFIAIFLAIIFVIGMAFYYTQETIERNRFEQIFSK